MRVSALCCAVASILLAFDAHAAPPQLTLTSPERDSTNELTAVVAGTAVPDAGAGPVAVTVNGTQVTVGADGSFSTTLPLDPGSWNAYSVVASDVHGENSHASGYVYQSEAP